MKIAVIIPTKFTRKTILKSLESVYNQTRKPDELIIVHGNNQAAQMNQAIGMSTCDAFTYLSDDDVLDPTFLEKHETFLNSYDVVQSRFTNFGENTESHISEWLVATNLTRKNIWEKVGKFDEEIGPAFDWDFYLKLKQIGARIGIIEESLWNYRVHPNQGSLETAQMKVSYEHVKVKHNL